MMAQVDWLARSRAASGLLSRGRAQEAATIFGEIARGNPRLPDAQNNLAVALRAAGRVKEAVDGYRRALKLNPHYRVARENLARALRELGRHDEALEQLATILRRDADDPNARSEAITTLTEMTFERPSPATRRLLLRFFARRDMDLQRLALPAARLLLANRRFAGLVAAARDAYPAGDPGRFLAPREIADPLLVALLSWTIVPLPEIEAWITLARRQLLAMVSGSDWASGGNRASGGERIDGDPALLWAIAAQCQATELAQAVTPGEVDAARKLAAALTEGDPLGLAVAAMFLPLDTLEAAHVLWRRISQEAPGKVPPGTPMRNLLARAIGDRAAERRIAPRIATLTAVEDATSAAVRGQYEANPYPKWLSVDRDAKPLVLAERMAKRFPALSTAGLDLISPRILVAGCGTGRHAIATAARHAGCQVLAVDLSQASLAYAARRAEALGQANIRFAQADILELGDLEERFDLIECSGVLHHMADPVAGWRALRGLMKPRGLMRIGLYSAHARRRWDSLRAPVPVGADAEAVNDFIRGRRASLLADPPDGGAAVVLRIADFYSLSGCRDLLFHAREMQFTAPRIADALASLDLEFLGFENLSPAVTEAFGRRFPAPGADRDLAHWDAFERDNPDTFIAMYQFWCQAREEGF